MKNTVSKKIALATMATAALCASAQLLAQEQPTCAAGEYPAQVAGRILNNAQPDTSPFGTLGVVYLRGDLGRLRCGIVGIEKPSGMVPGQTTSGLPSFTHTISCGDKIEIPLPDGTSTVLHSQLSFDTSGEFTGPPVDGVLPFIEHSVPITGSGRGVFAQSVGGLLTIKGTLNTQTYVIDMRFTGEVCMASPG